MLRPKALHHPGNKCRCLLHRSLTIGGVIGENVNGTEDGTISVRCSEVLRTLVATTGNVDPMMGDVPGNESEGP